MQQTVTEPEKQASFLRNKGVCLLEGGLGLGGEASLGTRAGCGLDFGLGFGLRIRVRIRSHGGSCSRFLSRFLCEICKNLGCFRNTRFPFLETKLALIDNVASMLVLDKRAALIILGSRAVVATRWRSRGTRIRAG